MKVILYSLIAILVLALSIFIGISAGGQISNAANSIQSFIKDQFASFSGSGNQGIRIVTSTPTTYVATPKPTIRPTPIPLKPDNGTEGTYLVSEAKHDGPNISKVIFDPLDVKTGQKLNISVSASYTNPIDSVKALLTEDNSSQNISFTQVSGTQIEGTWSGNITISDSVLYKYILTITVLSGSKSTTVIVAPRS